jgi:hypothetical protein
MRRQILIMLILITVSFPLSAGTNTGDFLYMPADPYSAVMGDGATAVRFGALSTLQSPGTLARIEARELHIANTFLSLDRRLSALAFSMPVGDRGALGLGVLQAAVMDIDGRDTNGEHTEYLDDTRNALSFVFGFRPHYRVSIGVGLKAFFRETAGESASGTGFDIGASALAWHDLLVTVAGRNLGATWPWNSDYWADALRIQKDDPIPAAFTCSVGSRNLPWGCSAGIGLLAVEGDDVVISGGIGIPVTESLVIRGGGSVDDPEIGFGFKTGVPFADVDIDYSYGAGELTADAIHRIALSTRF